MKPAQLRFGIGWGNSDWHWPLQSIGADGPAYWNASGVINLVHQKNDYGNTLSCIFLVEKEKFQINGFCLSWERQSNQTGEESQEDFKRKLTQNYHLWVRILVNRAGSGSSLNQCSFQTPKSGSIKIQSSE